MVITIIGIVLLIGLGVITNLLVGKNSYRIAFMAQNTLNLLIFVAVLVQASIYYAQAKIMENSLKISQQSYVGVHSIGINLAKNRFSLRIENIGKVPATNVRVDAEIVVTVPNEQSLKQPIKREYGETSQLMRGNLNIKIRIPLQPWLSEPQTRLIEEGVAQVAVKGTVIWDDEFEKWKHSEFAFSYLVEDDQAQWIPSAIQGAANVTLQPLELKAAGRVTGGEGKQESDKAK